MLDKQKIDVMINMFNIKKKEKYGSIKLIDIIIPKEQRTKHELQ